MTRKEIQQRLGQQRMLATTERLMHALDRMQSGKPVHLAVPFEWTKQNLAREAGVDESTLFRKKNGEYMYADVLASFECGVSTPKKETLAALRSRNAAYEEVIRKLQRQVSAQARELADLRKQNGPRAA